MSLESKVGKHVGSVFSDDFDGFSKKFTLFFHDIGDDESSALLMVWITLDMPAAQGTSTFPHLICF